MDRGAARDILVVARHAITNCHTEYGGSMLFRSGPGGSVGIATRYGLDGPGIESR
jgi:hypothetical protein